VNVAATLARFARRSAAASPGAACELCGAPVEERHRHVVDLTQRAVRCACAACAVLFRTPGAGAARFRTVPDRVLYEPGFALGDADWAALEIPVRLAFISRSSAAGRWIAVYPGPAGAVESALPLEAWARLSERSALVAAAEPDVEALLVRGLVPGGVGGGAPALRDGRPAAGPDAVPRGGALECLLVPIDRCYELAGRIRRVWRGFDGGAEARRELDGFFAALRERARPVRVEESPP
jgi:hypothetical protein